jgi:hypothetical protein
MKYRFIYLNSYILLIKLNVVKVLLKQGYRNRVRKEFTGFRNKEIQFTFIYGNNYIYFLASVMHPNLVSNEFVYMSNTVEDEFNLLSRINDYPYLSSIDQLINRIRSYV